MKRGPPRSTRAVPLSPYPSRFRSASPSGAASHSSTGEPSRASSAAGGTTSSGRRPRRTRRGTGEIFKHPGPPPLLARLPRVGDLARRHAAGGRPLGLLAEVLRQLSRQGVRTGVPSLVGVLIHPGGSKEPRLDRKRTRAPVGALRCVSSLSSAHPPACYVQEAPP